MASSLTRLTAALLAGAALVSAGASTYDHGDREDRDDSAVYRIALNGDMPYGDRGRAEYPNVIKEINAFRPAFTLFDGDTKSGSGTCPDSFYPANKAAYWDVYRQPAVYAVGDNEWTDCDRASNGGYDTNSRLAIIRQTYFSTPYSLGQHPLRVERAAGYPEIQRFTKGKVTYVVLHVTGSNNNYPVLDAAGKPVLDSKGRVDGDAAEAAARDAANQAWLRQSFELAKAGGSVAVMVVLQADMDWYHQFPLTPGTTDGFAATRKTLLQQTVGFTGQVVLVNGDSHSFVVDKPLADTKGETVENFTRVQTFGSAQNHWVSADVDPRDPQVFTFRQHIVTANLADHTGAIG
ncbi:MAG: hypothetical protein ABIV05_09770 [Actinomycetota bacterium]